MKPDPTYGILPDHAIRAAIARRDIVIDPFNPANLNPVSYDLTLGNEVVVYKRWVHFDEGYDVRHKFDSTRADVSGKRNGSDLVGIKDQFLDVKDEPETVKFTIDPDRGWILKPGIGYLMSTRERVYTEKYVPILDGKSSTARLFMMTHFCAGFGDPGYDGEYTLEVAVTHALKVYPGMKIAQIRFHTIATDGSTLVEKSYAGNYQGADARGPVASKAWKQFLKK